MSQSPLSNVEVGQKKIVNKSAFSMKEPKEEEPLFNDDYESSVEQKEIKEEEMSDNERACLFLSKLLESSHFAMSSFFSPARSVDRSRSLAPPREVKEEEIDEEASILEKSPAEGTFDSEKVEKTKRLSRNVSRPARYTQSMYDSDYDVESSVKKSKICSTLNANYKRKSSNGDESEDPSKKLNVSKENDTELKCPECNYRTRSVSCWDTHLRKKHATTPALAGLALLCGCGKESLSYKHSRTCNHGNHITVIRKRDGPIRRLDDEKTTPQCVLCEAFPRSARGYTQHLNIHHKSTLAKNGVYLMCSCGLEVRYNNNALKHLKDCNPRQFTLHNVDEEMYPKTATAYARHFYDHHKSTLKQNGIYLMCSCGLEVRSDNGHHKHLKGGDPRHFTLHRINDE